MSATDRQFGDSHPPLIVANQQTASPTKTTISVSREAEKLDQP